MGFHGGGWWSFLSYDESKGQPEVDRDLLMRVFGYARPYLWPALFMLVGITASSLLQLVPPLLYRDLIDNVLPERDFGRLNLLAVAMIVIPLVGGLIDVGQRYFSARVGEGVIFDLRQQMYDHLQHMSIRFFTNTKSGEIVSRFNNDVIGAQNAITGTLPNILTNVITLVTTFGIMVSIEWRLAVLSVAVLPLFLIPTRRVGRILRDIRRNAMEYNADMSSMISETLSINGALLVKTFGRQQDEVQRFRDVNRKVRNIGVRRAMIGRWFFLGLGIAGAIGTALIYWMGGHLVLRDTITIGTIVAFVAYLNRLYGPISALSNVQVEFASSMVSFERVFAYLDLSHEIQDKPGAIELSVVDGQIHFEEVSFTYRGSADNPPTTAPDGDGRRSPEEAEQQPTAQSREWALSDVSFEILPGQLAALVGPSGAGKTTITYLLPRLYDPTEGRILIDGHDLRDVTLDSLVRQIGMVTQETYLFHDTIRANLLYAAPDATEEELVDACRAANIHDFIVGLAEGYDTVVGERGYRLSGGEKQRLAIARVILKDPRILILDEATSHLDSQSEALIQEALERIMRDRTSLVIAHRLSTVLAADTILVLDRGRLVEQGTHSALIDSGGLYAELYQTQFARERRRPEPAEGVALDRVV